MHSLFSCCLQWAAFSMFTCSVRLSYSHSSIRPFKWDHCSCPSIQELWENQFTEACLTPLWASYYWTLFWLTYNVTSQRIEKQVSVWQTGCMLNWLAVKQLTHHKLSLLCPKMYNFLFKHLQYHDIFILFTPPLLLQIFAVQLLCENLVRKLWDIRRTHLVQFSVISVGLTHFHVSCMGYRNLDERAV